MITLTCSAVYVVGWLVALMMALKTADAEDSSSVPLSQQVPTQFQR